MKLKKPFDFLRKNPNGETIRIEKDLKCCRNGYFLEIGQYFKTAQILLLVFFILVFTVFSLTNSESITYQNLYYFAKDFRTAIDNTEASGEGFAYDVDGNPTFEIYKGGLAISGNERLRILTASGGINLSASLPLSNLLMVYGRGGTACHIYNSFTRIHSETLDGAIRSAYLSEAGAYAVVCEDDTYASAVYVYSRNFQKINKYNLNSYVVSAPLSANGKNVAILSYSVAEGVFTTHLRFARVGSDVVLCDYTVQGAFPLDVTFTADGRVLVLTDEGLYRVTEQNGGERIADLRESPITHFSSDADGIAVLQEGGAGSALLSVYGADGSLSYQEDAPRTVRAVRKLGDALFLHTEREIIRYVENGEKTSVACAEYSGELLAMSKDRAVLCTAGEAKYFLFE